MLYELDNGNFLQVDYDPWPENPRSEACIPAQIFTFERRYQSIDANPFHGFSDLVETFGAGQGIEPSGDFLADIKALNDAKPGYAFLPVSVHDHGIRNYYLGSPNDSIDGRWDASYVGVAVVAQESLDKNGVLIDMSTEKGMADLREHIGWDLDDYNRYANGEMTYMNLFDSNGVPVGGMEMGGFVGLDPEENGMLDYCDGAKIIRDLGDISIETEIGKRHIASIKEQHAKNAQSQAAERNRSGEYGKKAQKEQKKKDIYDIN